jgi:cyanophycin synthetase
MDDLASLKAVVLENVKPTGHAVINADDPLVIKFKDTIKAQVILFSTNPDNPALKENLERGNMNVTIKGDSIIIQKEGWTSVVAKIVEIPITYQGRAAFNIQNAMAATAAASALGLHEKQIRAGLVSFSPSIGLSPGRMNIVDIGEFKAIIDYGHNMGAIAATGALISNFCTGKRIRQASGTGNRREEDMREYGRTIAKYYDHVIVADTDTRGRPIGEVAEWVRQGLLEGGLHEDQIQIVLDGRESTLTALKMAQKGDVVVLQADDVQTVIKDVMAFKDTVDGASPRKGPKIEYTGAAIAPRPSDGEGSERYED